jgi:hypothetical protein
LVLPQEVGDFAIRREEGYVVKVGTDAVWNPGGAAKLVVAEAGMGWVTGGMVLRRDRGRAKVVAGLVQEGEVVLSDVTSVAAVVSWRTMHPAWGQVRYRAEGNNLWQVAEEGTYGMVHRVRLTELRPATMYACEIAGDGQTARQTFTTAQEGLGVSQGVWGRVLQEDGQMPAEGIPVYVRVIGPQGSSGLLSGVTDGDGLWVVNLGNLKEQLCDKIVDATALTR